MDGPVRVSLVLATALCALLAMVGTGVSAAEPRQAPARSSAQPSEGESRASARVGDPVLVGHRCRRYAPATSKENTLYALRDTADVQGAWCEVDTWRISDGTMVVFHDATWTRVIDPRTMPQGMSPYVRDATIEQVRELRTLGGKRVPTLDRMLAASQRRGVPLLIELKNTVPDIEALRFSFSHTWWYQQPRPGGACGAVDQLAAFAQAGATVGVKTHPDCPLTAEEMGELGATFVAERLAALTSDGGVTVSGYRQQGIEPFAVLAGRTSAEALRAVGVRFLVVKYPRRAARW